MTFDTFRYLWHRIKIRCVWRHHVGTGLQPGWYDFDERILHYAFNQLTNFIEVELASADPNNTLSLWNHRDAEAGIRTLDFMIDSCEPGRATALREIDMLYGWWKSPSRDLSVDVTDKLQKLISLRGELWS